MYCELNQVSQKIKCFKCGSHNLIEYSVDCIICADCGFVNSQSTLVNNDGGAGKRRRDTKQSKPISDGMEKVALTNANRVELKELIENLRVSDSIERNMAFTLYAITKIAFDLSLPEEVLMEAIHVYEEIAKKCNFKGKSLKALGSAIVYLASKKAGAPCSMREVAYAAHVPCNKVFKCYGFITTQLNETAHAAKVETYIRRVCNFLGVKDRTYEVAYNITKALQRSKHGNGKSLPALVSASVYVASKLTGEGVTQRQLAEVTRVTEATIRARCKDIIKNLFFFLTV